MQDFISLIILLKIGTQGYSLHDMLFYIKKHTLVLFSFFMVNLYGSKNTGNGMSIIIKITVDSSSLWLILLMTHDPNSCFSPFFLG